MSNETRPAQRGRAGQARRPDQTRTPDKKRGLDGTTLAFVGLVLVIIAGSAFLVLNNRSAADTGAIQEYSPEVTIEGDTLPVFNTQSVTSVTDEAVGMAAPIVTGQDFFGDDVTIPVEGESTIISFLAHWCPHCQAEVPLLMEEWIEADLPEGVNVAAVTTGTREDAANYPPSAWLLADNDWDEPILADTDDAQVASAYGLASYPYFVVVAPDGTVLARTSGELGRDQLNALVDVAAGAADAGSIGGSGEQSTVAPEDQ
ncbi:MAG TPA: TlpA disulfide reductase family protein [Nitriliruptoraceae bacterium]|nr:TlpA disulfide reductase family protein [Nitriliruptoraceae bacterium]